MLVWWCFCVGVVMFLWWCFCGGVLVVVFLWWCFCGAVRCVLAFVPPPPGFDDYLTPLYEESTSAEASFASVNIWVTFLYPLPLSPMTLETTTFSAQLYS